MARPQRLPSFDYLGLHRYFVTCCTLNRQRVFDSCERVEPTAKHFLQQGERFGMAIAVYCFMPDHAHLLAEGRTEDADFQSFVSNAKQKSGFDFAAAAGRKLWQKGFHERVLRDDETTQDVVRYIINNPVRAALVEHPIEYAFWGSGIHTREELLEYVSMARHR